MAAEEFREFSTNGLLYYCYLYQHDIYVRAFRDGWCNLPISELDGSAMLQFLAEWDQKKKYPHRIVREHKVEKVHE